MRLRNIQRKISKTIERQRGLSVISLTCNEQCILSRSRTPSPIPPTIYEGLRINIPKKISNDLPKLDKNKTKHNKEKRYSAPSCMITVHTTRRSKSDTVSSADSNVTCLSALSNTNENFAFEHDDADA